MNKYLTRLITHILVEDIEARDDWMDTIRQVHERELSLWCYTKEDYFDVLFSKKLSNVHTIKRLWQMVQERYPQLRGKTWEERQRQGGMMTQEFAEQNMFQMDLFFSVLPNNDKKNSKEENSSNEHDIVGDDIFKYENTGIMIGSSERKPEKEMKHDKSE